MSNADQISISDPKLSDSAVSAINARLLTRLLWLTTAFGACQRVATEKGVIPKTATTSAATKEYLSLLPNDQFGQFSFWDIDDGEEVRVEGDIVNLNFSAGLVFWGDLREVFTATADEWKGKTVSHVELLILEALKSGGFGSSRIQFRKVYRDGRNIYPGYYTDEVKRQFLMRPFFGLRIEIDVFFIQNTC